MIFLHCRISGQHFTKSLICDIVHSGDFYTTGKIFSLPPTLTNLILGWSHSAQAHSPVAISFLNKNEALPSHVDGKIWPHCTQFL